jgi:hypothetical protein
MVAIGADEAGAALTAAAGVVVVVFFSDAGTAAELCAGAALPACVALADGGAALTDDGAAVFVVKLEATAGAGVIAAPELETGTSATVALVTAGTGSLIASALLFVPLAVLAAAV